MSRSIPEGHTAWERLKGEPALWFERFTKYRRMGTTRSRIKLYKEYIIQIRRDPNYVPSSRDTTKEIQDIESCPSSWEKKAKEWLWDERVDRWDRHRYAVAEKEYQDRQEQIQEKSWELYENLFQRITDMIQFPVSEVVTEDDQKNVIIVKPCKWNARDIASHIQALKTLSEVAVHGVINTRPKSYHGGDNSVPVIQQGEATLISTPKLLTSLERQNMSNSELINRVLEQVADAE